MIKNFALDDHNKQIMDGDIFVFYGVVDLVLKNVVMLMELKLEKPMFDGLLRDDELAYVDQLYVPFVVLLFEKERMGFFFFRRLFLQFWKIC